MKFLKAILIETIPKKNFFIVYYKRISVLRIIENK